MKKRMHIYAVLLAAVLLAVMLAGCAEDYAEVVPSASGTVAPAVTEEGTDAGTEAETEAEASVVTEPDVEDKTESETLAPTGDVDSMNEVSVPVYPGIYRWYLDKKCDAERRAEYEEKWATRTPESRERIVELIEKRYGSQYNKFVKEHPGYYDTPAESESESEPETPEFGSVEAIAALGGLTATVQEDEDECLVYIFDDEKNHGNPYDVTWDYGKDYDAYVAAADWSLVFDAENYKATFPMLAVLYHDNDALLLRHFQTVGVHEGRQCSEGFNVAAYMDNCDKSLREAFGDNYECYYLYYLLHQDTESGVKTTGDYKKQLAQELTVAQAEELKGVNRWRKEVNAGTVEFDSEMAALANFRAYMDCTEGWNAHDGLNHMLETREFYGYMDAVDMDKYQENKCTVGYRVGQERVFDAASNYRNSQGHYETMVNPVYAYVGCSNFYVSDKDYNWSEEHDDNVITFDAYADAVTTAYHTK